MKLTSTNIWIEGGYYVDFDQYGQFRVIGPNNHLFFGLVDFPKEKLTIKRVSSSEGGFRLTISGYFDSPSDFFIPAMGDIRTVREVLPGSDRIPMSFARFRRTHFTLHGEALPMKIEIKELALTVRLRFRRFYGNCWYGVDLHLYRPVKVTEIYKPMKGWRIESSKLIPFKIIAETNDMANYTGACILPFTAFAQKTKRKHWKVFGEQSTLVHKIWEQTRVEIEHLICWGKTSGDRFGTVFPRDYLESILLGAGDLPQEAIDQMFRRCLSHINNEGVAWHEDVVGEYKFKHEVAGQDLFDRKMIDIEPLIILALDHVSKKIWQDKEIISVLSRIAGYILKRAEEVVISFKKLPKGRQGELKPAEEFCHGSYYTAGNWRDSAMAFKKIHPVIAPFDVNAVFYPEALSRIVEGYLGKVVHVSHLRSNLRRSKELLERWKKMHEHYQFTNADGLSAYALALYDPHRKSDGTIEARKMKVNNLDESYRYFLSDYVAEEELISFSKRLFNPDYFYTSSGPLIVGKKNKMGYTENDYHGLVIWMKQTAFTVSALSRWFREGEQRGLAKTTQQILLDAAIGISRDTLKVIEKLDVVPELHIDRNGEPAFFKGEMSVVQLWSAVGIRRIIREEERMLNC